MKFTRAFYRYPCRSYFLIFWLSAYRRFTELGPFFFLCYIIIRISKYIVCNKNINIYSKNQCLVIIYYHWTQLFHKFSIYLAEYRKYLEARLNFDPSIFCLLRKSPLRKAKQARWSEWWVSTSQQPLLLLPALHPLHLPISRKNSCLSWCQG